MTGTSAAVQATCRRPAYRPYRNAGRKAEYGRFSVLPRPEIHRNLRIKDSVKIDPTCGSASFLISTIRRIRNTTSLPSRELLERITNNVWGFDLNPLAVQTARVNYLIAVSDLIEDNPGVDVEIPILLADAIYSPAPDPEGDVDVVNYVIGSNVVNLLC